MKRLGFFSCDVFFNLIFNPFFILIYTPSLSNGVTLAKQMETAERLSNVVEVEVKIFRILKRCTVRVF